MPDALTQIEPDIYQLQIPLPFALNIVNVYLLRGKSAWTIVDTGINTRQARQTWQRAFAALSITPADIEQIVLTHVHPDHYGLAGWLQALTREAGCPVPVYASKREDEQARFLWQQNDSRLETWLPANGLPAAMAVDLKRSMDETRAMTLPFPPLLEHIVPGQVMCLGSRDFQTILAPGHSDAQIIFYDAEAQLLLSGDHVLMQITPNIGLWARSEPNPLGRFLQSLQELKSLPVRRALPGHKYLIDDWQGRIEELLAHHESRLQNVIHSIERGARTAYDVAQDIFETAPFTVHEWRFAIVESLAHLQYLQMRGDLRLLLEPRRYELV